MTYYSQISLGFEIIVHIKAMCCLVYDIVHFLRATLKIMKANSEIRFTDNRN